MPKRISRKSASIIVADLDRLADLFQTDYAPMLIPRDVAMDAAYRLDQLSDHIERVAEHFDANTIGEEKNGPLQVEDKTDDMPGEFTQEEFHSVADEATKRQAPLPKGASHKSNFRRRAYYPEEDSWGSGTEDNVLPTDDEMPGEFTQEEFNSVRQLAEERLGPARMRYRGRLGRSSRKGTHRSIRRAAGRKTLWVGVYGDGSLYAAEESPSDLSDFREIRDEEDAAVYVLKNVPEDLANELMAQGTRDQMFDDGYSAWDAAKRYVADIYDFNDDGPWDEDSIMEFHGVRR